MIIFGGLKEQADNREVSSKQRENVSQMTKISLTGLWAMTT